MLTLCMLISRIQNKHIVAQYLSSHDHSELGSFKNCWNIWNSMVCECNEKQAEMEKDCFWMNIVEYGLHAMLVKPTPSRSNLSRCVFV